MAGDDAAGDVSALKAGAAPPDATGVGDDADGSKSQAALSQDMTMPLGVGFVSALTLIACAAILVRNRMPGPRQ